jgi:AraC-like DNA-binding protein
MEFAHQYVDKKSKIQLVVFFVTPRSCEEVSALIEFVGMYSSTNLKKHFINHGTIWEIMACLRGSGTLVTGNRRIPFQKDDIIVQTPNTDHGFTADTDSLDLYLMVNSAYPFPETFKLRDTTNRDVRAIMMILYRIATRQGLLNSPLALHLYSAIVELIALCRGTGHRSACVDAMEKEIIENLYNPDFTMQEMYRRLCLPENRARKKFQTELGCTPHEYLVRTRISQAKWLLDHGKGDISISEVAVRVGIPDAQYFSRVFRKHTGMAPSAWVTREETP